MTLRRTTGVALFAALALPVAATAADLLGEERRIEVVEEALVGWDLVTAGWHAERLLDLHSESADSLLAASRVAFHEADYERAGELAHRAALAARGPEEERVASRFLDYLREREETWGSFLEDRSENFVVRATERDRLLVPMALDALESAAAAVDRELGYCPEQPVVVEIYPSRRTFIAASTLTREEVETSGTVAICHFNRIMIMSPAVMARGYDWLDTLGHEYIHHVIYHLGRDTVPVWLHEGIAKVLESLWRTDEPESLDPRMSTLLAEAREADRWVTFQEMHPSMAKLPSASLVSLAFAQVAVAVELMRDDGSDTVRRLIDELVAAGGDMDRALLATLGEDLGGFERRVRSHARSRELYRIAGLRLLDEEEALPFEFADEGETPLDPEVETRKLEDRKARDWTTLGDRLKGRGHHQAAVIEYEKALDRLGHAEPLVVNRKAAALIQAGRTEEALVALRAVLEDYPSLTTTLDNLAEVHARMARSDGEGDEEVVGEAPGEADGEAPGETWRRHARRAVELARRSERINPFNPDTHLRLVSLLDRLGRHEEAEVARERLRILREELQ